MIHRCNLTFNSEATSLRVPPLERLPPSMGLSPGFLPCGHWDRLSMQFSKGKREAVWQVRWIEKQRILRKGIHQIGKKKHFLNSRTKTFPFIILSA